MTQDVSSNGTLVRHTNIAEVMAGYPFLGAFIQEALRAQSTNASARVVLRDIMIEGRYLLERIPLCSPPPPTFSKCRHLSPSVASFDPQRFLQKKTKVPASAHRAYGNGASVCPGRHFAANEILIILIVTVCNYDLSPSGVFGMFRTVNLILRSRFWHRWVIWRISLLEGRMEGVGRGGFVE
jgi:cytochrome P450